MFIMHQSQHTINISERKEKKKSGKFCIPRFIDSLKRARSKNLQIKKTGMQFPTEGHAICKGRKRKTHGCIFELKYYIHNKG